MAWAACEQEQLNSDSFGGRTSKLKTAACFGPQFTLSSASHVGRENLPYWAPSQNTKLSPPRARPSEPNHCPTVLLCNPRSMRICKQSVFPTLPSAVCHMSADVAGSPFHTATPCPNVSRYLSHLLSSAAGSRLRGFQHPLGSVPGTGCPRDFWLF